MTNSRNFRALHRWSVTAAAPSWSCKKTKSTALFVKVPGRAFALSSVLKLRGTLENRPMRDTSKAANESGRTALFILRRNILGQIFFSHFFGEASYTVSYLGGGYGNAGKRPERGPGCQGHRYSEPFVRYKYKPRTTSAVISVSPDMARVPAAWGSISPALSVTRQPPAPVVDHGPQ